MRAEYHEMDHIMEVEAEHTKWWNTVDEYLSNDERASSIAKVHQVTLIVLRFESILALHRSILATSKKNSSYNAALQRCISASRSVINTLHKALKGFGAFDGSPGQSGYESTPLVWPSFTWAVWMSVFIIMFSATENQVSKETALRLVNRSMEILKHLALRGTNLPETCSIAVKNISSRLRETSTRSSTAASRTLSESINPTTGISYGRHEEDSQSLHDLRGTDQPRSGLATPRVSTMVHSGPQPNFGRNSLYTHQHLNGPLGSVDYSDSFMHNMNPLISSNPVSNHLGGAGNFLGIAQQSSDNPISNDEIMHLFNGEDMAYWLGGDNGPGNGLSFQGNFN